MKQISEGKVSVQRLNQTCGKAGQMKAPLLLLLSLLSTSLREKPAEHTDIWQSPTAGSTAAAKEEALMCKMMG